MSVWNTVFNYTFARGFIRIPIVLGVPIFYNKFLVLEWEEQFKAWNAGHNQCDIWLRLKDKVAKAQAEADE